VRCRAARLEVDAVRTLVGELTGVPAERVAFHSGATESLNLALRACLRPGDTVLTTAFEHSSVVRPLLALQKERQLRVEVLPPTADGGYAIDAAVAAIAALRPRLFVFTHASNVTGLVLDAVGTCEAAREHGCLTLLDACQTAGLLDIRVGADLVVASAHKALHGPPGIGFLAVRPDVELPTQKQGGTGSSVALTSHPTRWPQAFEAGTPNTPAIFALGAALRWVAEQQPARMLAHGLERLDELRAGLRQKARIRVLDPPAGNRVPILSFVHESYDTAELGAVFDAASVHVRTGFHCAPWIHGYLGTEQGGTVRLSPGPQTTRADVAAALDALA
ncbi:MAG: aminotransferase class V-fold PLP-dependent enzyme, partial [Planctomycetota bacterium]